MLLLLLQQLPRFVGVSEEKREIYALACEPRRAEVMWSGLVEE